MSKKVDAREVLKHLNSLGYTNVTAHQLKEFMTDLKKLMKYEDRMTRTTSEPSNVELNEMDGSTQYLDTTIRLAPNYEELKPATGVDDKHIPIDNHRHIKEGSDIFDYLHNQETISSEAKRTKPKTNVISVHIRKTCSSQNHIPHHDQHVYYQDISNSNRSKSESDLKHNTPDYVSTLDTRISSSCGGTIENSRVVLHKKSSRSIPLRPKSSFIRPKIFKTFKSDPVALHQHYEDEWKRNKIPGEDKRAELRWSIREKMMGGDRRI